MVDVTNWVDEFSENQLVTQGPQLVGLGKLGTMAIASRIELLHLFWTTA